MRKSLLLLAAISLPSPAATAAPIDWSLIDLHHTRSAECSEPGRPRRPAGANGARSEVWAAALLGWMLRLDRTRCPGLAAAAAIEVETIVDPPERPDVPLAFLDLAWRSATEGLGRVRDPVAAQRYGRTLWLLADEPPAWPEFTEPMQQQYVSRPEQIALLEAFLARSASGNARQARMLAELRSRRDLPGHDPMRAAALFGRAGDRTRQAELMPGGASPPPDGSAVAAATESQHAQGDPPANPSPRVAPVPQAQREAPNPPPRVAPVQQAQREAPPPPPRVAPVQQAQREVPAQLPGVASVQQAQRDAPAPPPRVAPVQEAQREAPASPPRAAPVQQPQREAPAPPPRAAPVQQAQREAAAPPPQRSAPAQQAQREAPAPPPRAAPIHQAQREAPAPPPQRSAPVLALREAPAQREATFQPTPLQLGQRAAESAQTDQERVDALRTLFAASLAGGSESCTALAAQLGRVRPSTYASLTREDLDRIERMLRSESSGVTLNPGGRALLPVLTRGLIDSSGRLVMAQLVRSSGSTATDQAVMAGWLRLTGRLTLSARPRAAAWVPLPPSFPAGDDVPTEPAARSLCL